MGDFVNDTFEDLITSLDQTITRLRQPGAQGDPDAKTERAYFLAQRRAYVKAQAHWLAGVRAQDTGRAWLIPSATNPGAVYRIVRQGDVLVCDCQAAQNERLCWHKTLLEVQELAYERLDEHDDGLETSDQCGGTLPPAPVLALVPRPRDEEDDVAYADMVAAFGRLAA